MCYFKGICNRYVTWCLYEKGSGPKYARRMWESFQADWKHLDILQKLVIYLTSKYVQGTCVKENMT